MKKAFALLLLLSMLLVTLSSCNLFWMDKHPVYQHMTKWEGDGLELYIGQCGEEILLVAYGEEELIFKLTWHGNGLARMGLCDIRPIATVPEDINPVIVPDWIWIPVGYNVSVRRNGTCHLSATGDVSYYGGLLPEKAILKKTADNLTYEDFPQIDSKKNDNYRFCPIFYPGTNWVSDDGKVKIEIDATSSNVFTIFLAEGDRLYTEFIEFGSMLYAGKHSKKFPYNLPLAAMQEHWQCEYFEDYFMATVIKSDRYEIGKTIIFTKEQPQTKPNDTLTEGTN